MKQYVLEEYKLDTTNIIDMLDGIGLVPHKLVVTKDVIDFLSMFSEDNVTITYRFDGKDCPATYYRLGNLVYKRDSRESK